MPFGFYSLAGAWLGLLIGPLVLFYFLKLKRQRVKVPSLVLWQQVLNDSRVNSPFQRFKRNILLLLQLLLLLLLILGAMQPFWRGGAAEDAYRLPILIDVSASMSAVDEQTGRSRFELAKDKARDIIDQASSRQQIALITFGRTARLASSFTDNRRVLLDALDGIELEHVTSDIGEALRMAEALTRTTPFERAVMLTDRNVPASVDFEAPFGLELPKLPPAGPNVGITALSARRAVGGGWNVFVGVAGSSDAALPVELSLIQDGRPVAAERVIITDGAPERLVFTISGDKPTSVELRLAPDGFDALAADNRAYLELSPTRPLLVHVSDTLPRFRHALEVMEQVSVYPREGDDAPPGQFDLAITDSPGGDEDAVDAPVTLSVGVIPPDAAELLVRDTQEGTSVIDWRRTEPLLEYMEMTDMLLSDNVRYAENAQEHDLENLHYEVLAYGRHGPLMLKRSAGARTGYYLLFHPDRSTLPYRVAFPIMVSNLVRVSAMQAGLLESRGEQTGVLPAMTFAPGASVTIKDPAGGSRTESADSRGELSGIPAPRVGRYTLEDDTGAQRRVGVSLLSADETSLAAVERINFGEQQVQAAGADPAVNRALWRPLALIALIVLMIEWWFFQRRPGGVPR